MKTTLTGLVWMVCLGTWASADPNSVQPSYSSAAGDIKVVDGEDGTGPTPYLAIHGLNHSAYRLRTAVAPTSLPAASQKAMASSSTNPSAASIHSAH